MATKNFRYNMVGSSNANFSTFRKRVNTMKKIILMAVTMTACSVAMAKGTAYDAAQLVGTWQCETKHNNLEIDQRIQLNQDGTYQVEREKMTAILSDETQLRYEHSYSGEWQLKDAVYKITMQKHQFAEKQPASTIVAKERASVEKLDMMLREQMSRVPQESVWLVTHLSADKWVLATPRRGILTTCQKVK